MNRRRKASIWVAATALTVLLAAGATLGWAAAAYVRLVGLEVAMADACGRAEATNRGRLAMVDTLLQESFGIAADDPARIRLVEARDRLRGLRLHALDGPADVEGYDRAQRDLTFAARDWLDELRALGEPVALAVVDDLEPALDLAAERVMREMDAVNHGARDYRSAQVSFPGSVVAALVGPRP